MPKQFVSVCLTITKVNTFTHFGVNYYSSILHCPTKMISGLIHYIHCSFGSSRTMCFWKLFLLVCVVETATTLNIEQIVDLDICLVSNTKYFTVIGWFLGRSMDLTVSVIEDGYSTDVGSHFTTSFLRDFMRSMFWLILKDFWERNYNIIQIRKLLYM